MCHKSYKQMQNCCSSILHQRVKIKIILKIKIYVYILIQKASKNQ